MIISYQTRQLRDEILNDFLLQNKFPQEVVKRLKFYLSILSAADNVSSTPLNETFRFNGKYLEIDLPKNLIVLFKIANCNLKALEDSSYDWSKVNRLQLLSIGLLNDIK
ncbi:MAG: hypothetical protein VB956_02170 [Moraxella sp.]